MSQDPQDEAHSKEVRRGCWMIVIIIVVVVGGIIAAVNLWPESAQEREDRLTQQAIDACTTAVNNRVSTHRAKRWSDLEATKDGNRYRVQGHYFSAGESADFVCYVNSGGGVTSVTVIPS